MPDLTPEQYAAAARRIRAHPGAMAAILRLATESEQKGGNR